MWAPEGWAVYHYGNAARDVEYRLGVRWFWGLRLWQGLELTDSGPLDANTEDA
jgi:hypothetical protein